VLGGIALIGSASVTTFLRSFVSFSPSLLRAVSSFLVTSFSQFIVSF
jgi:hypothetical protein